MAARLLGRPYSVVGQGTVDYTLRNSVMLSLVFMFVTTSFVANAVIRDEETGFGPIVRSTGITKFEYLIGLDLLYRDPPERRIKVVG